MINQPPIQIVKRPLAVIVVALIFIAAGVFGLIHHFPELFAETDFINYEALWVLFLRALSLIIGIYLLRGANWSRWLALAWIAYHVVLSAFHSALGGITHFIILMIIAFLLFLPKSGAFFRN